jgi:cell division protein FtsI/penicillin-binding protein 2
MRTKKLFFVILLFFLCFGCVQPTAILSTPESTFTPILVPGAMEVAENYLKAWQREDYITMYELLTFVSQAAISEQEFRKHYQSIMDEAILSGVDTEILAEVIHPDTAQVHYRVNLHSSMVGDVIRETMMNLSLENNLETGHPEWRVQWDDTLVLPELKGANYLWMDRQEYVPARANIYDRNGNALVAHTQAVAIGLIPDLIDPAQQETLFAELEALTGKRPEQIQAMYANFPKGANWYLPLGEAPTEQINSRLDILKGFSGLEFKPYDARFYFANGIASHVLGYMGPISELELNDYLRQGYESDDRVGKTNLEKWGESYLAGQRGGALYVLNGQGNRVTRLAEATSRPGDAIYTSLDRDFQLAAQQAIAGFRGAIVVMEKDTGRILAMVSSPGYDPNVFEPMNYNSGGLDNLLTSPDQPLLNRATQGLYPLGSVFKTIVMASALESGRFSVDSTLQCGYTFEELGSGTILYDWTYEYFQSDHKTKPSGLLTLSQGLVRSCNPWFYHIGLDLFRNGMPGFISEIARGFGLGKPTGIETIAEESGNVPVPTTDYDATNLGIGQGDLLVTPLQVATFIAAIGNGGTLYQPQVVDRVVSPEDNPVISFSPKINGKLPLKPETLQALQDAMVGVIRSTKPYGTAWHQFTGLDIDVAGKTGTATSGSGAPHAWFAGYTFEGRPDKPDIAVAVILENAGEGSAYAAPIFRRIIELYFSGQPQKLYEWESTYGVPRTPVP